MPELPEVETIRRDLLRNIAGGHISRARIHSAGLRYPFPDDFAESLDGAAIKSIERRAKFLLLKLTDGKIWVTHLGMTGHFALDRLNDHGETPDRKYRHFECEVKTDAGRFRLSYCDQRRFGYMLVLSESELQAADWYQELGVEPLSDDFTGAVLEQLTAGKKADIKSLLTDQKRIAGIGNAYVCEALWTAKVLPDRPAGSISKQESSEIAKAVKSVLSDAVEAGEATITADETAGQDGYFDFEFKIYDREGAPCPRRDGGTIEWKTSKGRSTFFCAVCQK